MRTVTTFGAFLLVFFMCASFSNGASKCPKAGQNFPACQVNGQDATVAPVGNPNRKNFNCAAGQTAVCCTPPAQQGTQPLAKDCKKAKEKKKKKKKKKKQT